MQQIFHLPDAVLSRCPSYRNLPVSISSGSDIRHKKIREKMMNSKKLLLPLQTCPEMSKNVLFCTHF